MAKTKTTQEKLEEIENSKPAPYTPSSDLTDLLSKIEGKENDKPDPYNDPYASDVEDLWNKIKNRDPFSYDFNADPLYQQYKDQYTRLGNKAMQDTMGNAAALTGGYGSSYASTAGNQAYQSYLDELNNVIPELYQLSYTQYRDEGQDLYNQMGTLNDLRETDYGRYRDLVSDYKWELEYLFNKYGMLSQQEFDYYMANLDAWDSDRQYYFGKDQAEQAQENWEKEQDFAREQWEWNKQNRGSSGGGGGGGSSGGKSSKSTSSDYDAVFSLASQYNNNGASQDAYWMIQNAASSGRITAAEAAQIMASLGIDPEKYQNSGNTGKSPQTSRHH